MSTIELINLWIENNNLKVEFGRIMLPNEQCLVILVPSNNDKIYLDIRKNINNKFCRIIEQYGCEDPALFDRLYEITRI